MAEKNPKKTSDIFLSRDIDPEVESRIDELMSEDEPSPLINIKSSQPTETLSAKEASSAPLLPSDKLPALGVEKTKNAKPKVEQEPSKIIPVEQGERKESEPIKPTAEEIEQIDDEALEIKPDNEDRFEEDKVGLSDEATEKAVDEITSAESDRMLAIEDAKAELLSEGSATIETSFFARISAGLYGFMTSRKTRYAFVLLVLATLAALAIFPTSRYFALNTVGVRASSSLTVLDQKTQQPLKNVDVSIDGQSIKTDDKGYVSFQNIKLGHQNLSIRKPAFAENTEAVVIGWGSNPLGDRQITAVGSQYSFSLVDFLSGKPITKAEAISGDASALADKNGEVILAVDDRSDSDVEVMIKAEGYRAEKRKVAVGSLKLGKITMVPVRKHAFISNRDGKFDLYKVDVDGKNEAKVLAGTGKEQSENIVLLHHPSRDIVALTSSRDGTRDGAGFLKSTLNIVDLTSDQSIAVTTAEQLQVIDFIGDKIVFVRVKAGTKEASSNHYQLMSYDINSAYETELASANFFNDVLVANGEVYYSPSAEKSSVGAGFYKTKPDGSSRHNIFSRQAWNIFRTGYNKLTVSIEREWYDYDLSSGQLNKLDGEPPSLKSRLYIPSPNSGQSLWVDERDGKGVLLSYNNQSGNDKSILTIGGLRNPVRWLDNDHVIYRLNTSSESADYVLSLSGGEPKKIKDVTDTSRINRFYY